ncbi:MAG: cupin domain-containing protein [Colwellia sp.]|nr:cupin domain-containing protein [Colwellia sp.]
MNTLNWGELTPEKFLKEYWQKKPLIIKGAFSNFQDPISADELAGLAMEPEIQSRIIAKTTNADHKTSWQVTHGPFEQFDQFGESGWTLLVQAVNNFSANSQLLLDNFKFVPSWRVDDVMVSFSTPNGGVGAHLDQYDVFIIQGEGKRHWQVGAPDPSLKQLLPHEDLKQVSDFTPIVDEITEPGDLLYIPPNHPHNGIAIDNSLNYSVGFQAPNNQELFSGFADKLLDDDIATQRFNDVNRKITHSPELLSAEDIGQLKLFMQSAFDNQELFNQFIGRYLTQSHHPLEMLIPIEPITDEQLDDILAEDENLLVAVSGIKALIIEEPSPTLFISGEAFELDENTIEFGKAIAKEKSLTTNQAKSFTDCLKNRQLLTNVLNKGFWYIE